MIFIAISLLVGTLLGGGLKTKMPSMVFSVFIAIAIVCLGMSSWSVFAIGIVYGVVSKVMYPKQPKHNEELLIDCITFGIIGILFYGKRKRYVLSCAEQFAKSSVDINDNGHRVEFIKDSKRVIIKVPKTIFGRALVKFKFLEVYRPYTIKTHVSIEDVSQCLEKKLNQ